MHLEIPGLPLVASRESLAVFPEPSRLQRSGHNFDKKALLNPSIERGYLQQIPACTFKRFVESGSLRGLRQLNSQLPFSG
jgi:hypothetical protein